MIVFLGKTGDRAEAPDTAEGIGWLYKMESADVTAVEKKIRERDDEERRAQEDRKNRTPNEKMERAVILGDSRANVFVEFGILDESKVLAEIGISLQGAGPYVKKAIQLNPEHVFLSYGLNNIDMNGENTTLFVEEYKKIIHTLKEGLPDSKI